MRLHVARNESGDPVLREVGRNGGTAPFTAEHWWMYYWPYVAAPRGSGMYHMRWG